jgi:hypothetical protein
MNNQVFDIEKFEFEVIMENDEGELTSMQVWASSKLGANRKALKENPGYKYIDAILK